ncbi:unnamed protein product [Agarophyton chilense]
MGSELHLLKRFRTDAPEKIRHLIECYPNLLKTRSADDATPLHLVVAHNPQADQVALILIDRGADVNARGFGNQNKTVLQQAAWRGCARTIRLLIQHGARVDAVKSGDWTALMVACARAKSAAVKQLLDAGARTHLVNRSGETALHLSARAHCVDAVQLLVGHGADLHARTRNGRQPLHYAARAGSVECARVLAAHGANWRVREAGGMTAGVEACAMGHTAVMCLALEMDGCNVWEKDCGGLNGLHHAAVAGHLDIVRELVTTKDADIEARDARGQTALVLAVCNGQVEIAEELGRADGGFLEATTVCASAPGWLIVVALALALPSHVLVATKRTYGNMAFVSSTPITARRSTSGSAICTRVAPKAVNKMHSSTVTMSAKKENVGLGEWLYRKFMHNALWEGDENVGYEPYFKAAMTAREEEKKKVYAKMDEAKKKNNKCNSVHKTAVSECAVFPDNKSPNRHSCRSCRAH